MILKKMLKFIINCIPFSSLRRKLRNRIFLKKHKQLNKKYINKEKKKELLFLFTTNTSNVGDLVSSPVHYFDFGCKNATKDIIKLLNNNILQKPTIIGGGIHPWLFQDMDFTKRLYKKDNIAWGIGTFPLEQYSEAALNRFSLVGIREYNSPMIDNKKVFYCPCSSCMSSLFDLRKISENNIIFYLHKLFTPVEFYNDISSKYSTFDNYNHSFFDVVRFLSTGNIVVTNSYHGMYWATLLGKKVVFIDIHDKGKGMKWLPIFADYTDWEDKILYAKSYENALNEARQLNISFYEKVIKLVGD